MADLLPIAPGSTLRDCDPRMYGRRVRVLDVTETHVTAMSVHAGGYAVRIARRRIHAKPERTTGFYLEPTNG